ncbi:pyridoxamine 5'-phosphate oxidase family protein [Spirosoma sp. SC4-14]|uniref:pyridoxamine 5'-phosphate oxidase family protein n=1 Tax=Spirosoma sp. SC4-14 TaxID=3128900 RepID=UPI0030D0F236
MLHHLSDEVIDYMLNNQWFGRLGCAADNEILVVPVTYLYDGHNIYGHTREGTKTRLMRQNPNVCLEVDEVVSPTFWQSVLVHGQFEELTGDERTWVLQRLGQRLAPLFPNEMPIPASEIGQPDSAHEPPATVVYRIRITEKSGRSIQLEQAVDRLG